MVLPLHLWSWEVFKNLGDCYGWRYCSIFTVTSGYGNVLLCHSTVWEAPPWFSQVVSMSWDSESSVLEVWGEEEG